MVRDIDARRLHRSNRPLSIPISFRVFWPYSIENNSLHVAAYRTLIHEAVVISGVDGAVHVVSKIPEPPLHVRPREEHRNRDRLIRRVLSMPAIDRDGIAALAVI